jgi:transposase-like protein
MFPFELLSSEASAANLLEQVRWREGLCCPRCRSESVIKHGSYREYQRYLCNHCDRTFNDKTGTIFAPRRRMSICCSRCGLLISDYGSVWVFDANGRLSSGLAGFLCILYIIRIF